MSKALDEFLEDADKFENPNRFINRELSWLKFNQRVLAEACRNNNPLLERLRFLSISGSNLDEFVMVRVAGLIGQITAGVEKRTPEDLTPNQQLALINESIEEISTSQSQCWAELQELFAEEGIYFPRVKDLSDKDKKWAEKLFEREIFPLLTPIAVDPAHPFPFIPNRGVSLALKLYDPAKDETLEALVPMPPQLPRFFKMAGDEERFVTREKIILMYVDRLFPAFELTGKGVFRVLRDSDVEIDEDAEDLVRTFETALKRRRRGHVIRLKVNKGMPQSLKKFLRHQMDIVEESVEVVDGFIGYADLGSIEISDQKNLKYPHYNPRYPERIKEVGGNCFAAISLKDMIIHHPYESFDVVVDFIRQAALDPKVVAIKQTLYRTSNDSPIIKSLIQAAESGKSVTAMVELRARFDEEANIRWARDLERAGVHVVYGFVDLKTHAKISLVIRRETGGLKSYVHFGTGNYHPITAKIYTDLSLFSCDENLCEDAGRMFNYMTGYASPEKLSKCALAPINLRERLVEHIDTEIENAQKGLPAQIWAKMNALVDPQMIDKFYEASNAGVEIHLIIRGICCLRPQVKGLSENIYVRSIVGRFLEHSRVFCFANGADLPSEQAIAYISSSDLMPRNLNRRIEALIPLENSTVKAQLLQQVMLSNLKDNQHSWFLQEDGDYKFMTGATAEPFSAHQFFMDTASLSGRGSMITQPEVTLEEGD